MGKPIEGILVGDAAQCLPHGLGQIGRGSGLGAAQQGLDFAPHFFDRIQIRLIGGQENYQL